MTFAKPRFNSGYDYELVRYCSIKFTTIVGGASKLLNYFKIIILVVSFLTLIIGLVLVICIEN